MIKIAHSTEIPVVAKLLSQELIRSLTEVTTIFDAEYGTSRNVSLDSGGYSLIIENSEDLKTLTDLFIDVNTVIAEYVDEIIVDSGGDWLKALIQLGDDYFVALFLPKSMATENLLNQIGKGN